MRKNIFTIFKIILIILLLVIYCYISNVLQLPEEIVLLKGEKFSVNTMYGLELIETANNSTGNVTTRNLALSLFGNKTLKEITVNTISDIEVVPLGNIIGLKLYTEGVLVVGMSEIESVDNEMIKPYENVDIQEGDTIIMANEEEIDNIESLKEIVNGSNGESIVLTILRDNNTVVTSNISPIKTGENEYKLGLWVKDAATGVGTITFYEKETGFFGALRAWYYRFRYK